MSKVLLLSVFAHGLFFVIIFINWGDSALDSSVNALSIPDKPALNSYVVFTPKPRSTASVEEIAEPNNTAQALPAEAQQISPQNTQSTQGTPNNAPPAPIQASEAAIDVTPNTVLRDTSNAQNDNKKKAPFRPSLNKDSINRAVQNYQQSLNNQAIDKMAQEEAKAFMERDSAPIVAPDLMPLEERQAVLRQVQVDCSSLLKKSAVVLSGLGGGTVTCRSLPDFQQYIDKRLNKEEEDKQN